MDELELQMQKESARLDTENGTGSADNSGDQNNAGDNNNPANTPPAQTGDNNPNDAAKDAPAGAPAADQNNNNAAPATTTNDFFANIEQLSGGAFKSKDDFDAAITKAKEFDGLKAKVTDYEAKMAISPFADEYEQKRNELKRSGATKEQLKAFETVNDLGDLSAMDPKEALVMKMILVDKRGEKAARLKVDKEFDLENTHDDELDLMKDELEHASRDAKKALEQYRAEVSTPNQDKVLLDAAGKEQLKSQLKPTLDNFAQNVNSLATVSIEGKNGEQAVTVNLDLNADDKAFITSAVQEIMISENLPLTQENYNYAVKEAKRDFLEANQEKIIRSTWEKAETHYRKLYSEKYENTGGKPPGDTKEATKQSENDAAFKQWKKGMLS